ncbi:MAG TPA: hypothetical protein PLH64_04600 [Anaerolineaceae bacterium]|nr:hypothetical protein [Anaerolineaceae bacterium]
MKRILLPMIILLLTLSACVTTSNTNVEAELRATLVAVNVQSTVQAEQIASLQTLVMQPTATCPVCQASEPTATPITPTETPIPPTETPITPTETPVPTATVQATGSVSGRLGYPSEMVPPLRVVAFNILTGEFYWQNTVLNQMNYRFEALPVGTYHVLAYLIENPTRTFYAAYSNYVTCGYLESCTDHTLAPVEVKAGVETTNVDPNDWYGADPESLGWPLDPTINWN